MKTLPTLCKILLVEIHGQNCQNAVVFIPKVSKECQWKFLRFYVCLKERICGAAPCKSVLYVNQICLTLGKASLGTMLSQIQFEQW